MLEAWYAHSQKRDVNEWVPLSHRKVFGTVLSRNPLPHSVVPIVHSFTHILSQPAPTPVSSPSNPRPQPQRSQEPQPDKHPKLPPLVPVALIITPRVPPPRQDLHHEGEIPHKRPRHRPPAGRHETDLEDAAVRQGEGGGGGGEVVRGQRGGGGVVEGRIQGFEGGGGELEGEEGGEGVDGAEGEAGEG